MTILGRLHTKGLLDRRREGKTDYYRPVHTRAEYADLRAQAEVAALVDAYGDVALGHFARQVAELDPERRRALERLARGAESRPRGPRSWGLYRLQLGLGARRPGRVRAGAGRRRQLGARPARRGPPPRRGGRRA